MSFILHFKTSSFSVPQGLEFLGFNCLWNRTLSFNPLVQSHFPPSLFSHTIELTYSKIEFIKLKTMWVINIMHCLLIPGYSIYFFTVYSTSGPHCWAENMDFLHWGEPFNWKMCVILWMLCARGPAQHWIKGPSIKARQELSFSRLWKFLFQEPGQKKCVVLHKCT